MDRREFTGMLAAFSISADSLASPGASTGEVEVLRLGRNGWMPNNERLPVVLYHHAVSTPGNDPAANFEALFTSNGWPPQGRNGVYTFHHYHSTAHEVLGFATGSARLMLGGENGHEVTVQAGDVVLLPAGTGHCELEKSADFLVVGAYPPGQSWDICRSAPDAAAQSRMATLPYPGSDPVRGAGGPLQQYWRS